MKRLLSFAAMAVLSAGLEAAVFTDGERLTYNLYIGPVRAGEATLTTKAVTYNGQNAYRMQLIANTVKTAEKIYSLHDTLTSTVTSESVPLEYWKHAHEGGYSNAERTVFSMTADGRHVANLHKLYRDGHTTRDNVVTSSQPIYDLVSIMAMTRSMDTRSLYVGKKIDIQIVDGADVLHDCLVYKGRETLKVGGEKVECLEFNVVAPNNEKGKTKYNDVLTIFVSDDDRHVVVQLEISLGFGAVKAKLQ